MTSDERLVMGSRSDQEPGRPDSRAEPSWWSVWSIRVVVAVYVLGFLVMATAWSAGSDSAMSFSPWVAVASGMLIGHTVSVGAIALLWWAGQPRVGRAARREARRAVADSRRRDLARAILRGAPRPPREQLAVMSWARAQSRFVPPAAVLLLIVGPVLVMVLHTASSTAPSMSWSAAAPALAVLVLADGLLWWARRCHLAVSRWSDPPGPAVRALHLDPAYQLPDWGRWRRDLAWARGVSVAAIASYAAGIVLCLVLRSDPTTGVACLIAAGVVVIIAFGLFTAGWVLSQRHRLTPRESRRLAALPAATRAEVGAALRRGRRGDPRYLDVVLSGARAGSVDTATVPALFSVMLALSLAFTTPLLQLAIPVALYPGLATLLVAVSALFSWRSHRHQQLVESLLAQAHETATRHQPLSVLERRTNGGGDGDQRPRTSS